MGNRIKLGIVVAGAVAIGAGLTALMLAREPAAAAQAAPAPPAEPVSPTVAVHQLQSIPQPPPTSTLPPVDAPLGLVIDDLRRRAEAGEASATCRLAAEYSRCGLLRQRRNEQDQWLADRRRALDLIGPVEIKQQAAENIERELALRDEQLGALEAHCADVDVPDARSLTRLWRNAALAGDPAAMRQYASGNAFQWGNLLDALPELATYRQEAEGIAVVAARRGDLDTLITLASAYSGSDPTQRSLLHQAVRPDPAMALAMYRHIEAALVRNQSGEERITREVRDRIADLEAGLAGDALVRADDLAAGMARDWTPPVVRGVGELHAGSRQREIDRRWCGR